MKHKASVTIKFEFESESKDLEAEALGRCYAKVALSPSRFLNKSGDVDETALRSIEDAIDTLRDFTIKIKID